MISAVFEEDRKGCRFTTVTVTRRRMIDIEDRKFRFRQLEYYRRYFKGVK